jgi:hypothetical protein
VTLQMNDNPPPNPSLSPLITSRHITSLKSQGAGYKEWPKKRSHISQSTRFYQFLLMETWRICMGKYFRNVESGREEFNVGWATCVSKVH